MKIRLAGNVNKDRLSFDQVIKYPSGSLFEGYYYEERTGYFITLSEFGKTDCSLFSLTAKCKAFKSDNLKYKLLNKGDVLELEQE